MPDAVADVYQDGTVLWVRNGALKAICQFSGLSRIPYDSLGCQFLFGSWERIRRTQLLRYTLYGDNGTGVSFGDFDPLYNHYRVEEHKSTGGLTLDSSVFVTLYFRRATDQYVVNLVVPTIILTFVSFGVFLLDLAMGERLSYGLALALVVVAQQIVTNDLLPTTSEKLWIDKFIAWSFYWVIFGVVESVVMAYFFTLEEHAEEERKKERERKQRERKYLRSKDKERQQEHRRGLLAKQLSRKILDVNLTESSGNEEQSLRNILETIPDYAGAESVDSYDFSEDLDDDLEIPEKKKRGWWRRSVLGRKWTVRDVDHLFFAFTTFSYIVFIVVMYATLPLWGKDDSVYYATEKSNLEV